MPTMNKEIVYTISSIIKSRQNNSVLLCTYKIGMCPIQFHAYNICRKKIWEFVFVETGFL